MTDTVTIDLNETIKNAKGEAVKDMIDQPADVTRDSAPDLTVGSLLSNALMVGITNVDKKNAEKYFRLAGEIVQCIKNDDGKYVQTRDQLNELEQAWGKVNSPSFAIPMYAGAIQNLIEDKKTDLRIKEKETKEKAKTEKPTPKPQST